MNRTRHRLPSILILSALLLTVAACSDEDVTNILPAAEELFTVTGRVLSYPSLQPVGGASYSLLAGLRTGACDASGRFEIADVEKGSHLVSFASAGHAPGLATARLGAESSYTKNSRAHWDLHLVETTASLAVRVYGAPSGLPLVGAEVSLVDVRLPMAIASRVDLSAYSSSAITDDDGVAVLTGLPAATVVVAITAGDADANGVADFATQTREVALRPEFASAIDVVMVPGVSSPTILATNMPSYSGDYVHEAALWFVFSLPMDTSPDATRVTVESSGYPYDDIPASATWTSPLRLEVTSPGQHVDGSVSVSLWLRTPAGATFNYSRSVRWQNDAEPLPGDCEGVVGDLRLGLGHAPLDLDSTVLSLTWSAVPGAGGYDVYARDDRNNPDWTWLAHEPTDFDTGSIAMNVTLPTIFDRFAADGVQTPLAGTAVTLCVVPRLAVNRVPGTPHGMLSLADTTPPTLLRAYQSGAAANTGSEPLVFNLVVEFSEYVDADVTAPVLTVIEAGGDPAFAFDPADAVWTWENGRHGGAFSYLVEPGQNASGDRVQVSFVDLRDLSGNVRPGTVVSEEFTTEPWSNQFDFERSAQGWTDVGAGWEWGHPSLGPQGGHSSDNCWGTSLHVPYGTNWDTSVTSPPFVIRAGATRLRYWRWASVYYDDAVTVQVVREDNSTANLTTYTYSSSSNWVAENFDLSSYVGRTIRVRFRFQTDNSSYNDRDGFFFDNVGIGVE